MIGSAYVKRTLGIITVKDDGRYIILEGVGRYTLETDIQKAWKTSVVTTQMFEASNSLTLKFAHFWALDVVYILQTLYREGRTRTPRRTIGRLIELMKEQTWVGRIQINEKDLKQDLSGIMKYSIFTPKNYQLEFLQHYPAVVKAYRLKGYMLDAGPGTGKTLTQLMLAQLLNPGGVRFLVVPKNSVVDVWHKTITTLLTKPETIWHSLMGTPPTLGVQNYVLHYEQLDMFRNWVKANQRHFNNVYLGLDESHKFNRMVSDRTNYFLELSALPCVTNTLWGSGTPISALGSECIPFLKCIDPYFTPRIEERFRKIYGKDAKRANDILRNRIGHLKFHVPSQSVVSINVETFEHKVTMPGAEKYTLEVIAKDLRAYMDERNKYYAANYNRYKADYDKGIQAFLDTPAYKRNPKAYETYRAYVKTISMGYDPQIHKEESMYCNQYERKTIMPAIDSKVAKAFKSAASVIKYVHLKVLGEALGLLGKYRSRCFKEMVPYSGLPDLIDGAKKKTIIFTSYVDVVENTAAHLTKEGYSPILVYGETNAALPAHVKRFFEDKDANPLIATFQSLAEAVPLIAANRIIFMNQPFRANVKTQSIARAARLGQDEDVDVFDALLDTGTKENISTRNQDIMEWSDEMVKSIMGTDNLDLTALAMEGVLVNDAESEVVGDGEKTIPLPGFLYHGSHYDQNELMPGCKRSGVVTKWDQVESNEYLYATTDFDAAVLLGIASALEKTYGTTRYDYDEDLRTITIQQGDVTLPTDWKSALAVYVYRITCLASDGWYLNYNTQNGITTEYKTNKTIKENLLGHRKIDLVDYLDGWDVQIQTNNEAS